MKRTSRTLYGILLGAALFFVAGCEKGDTPRGSVSFSAAAGPDDTRTSYSGDIRESGGVKRERIDWSSGDTFTVYSDKTARVTGEHLEDFYVVTWETASDPLMSRATVGSVHDHGLQWGDATGTVTFCAGYPDGTISVVNDSPILSGTIPASQTLTWSGDTGSPDMSKAYMYAKTTAEAGAPAVTLYFYPIFTAFEFAVSSGDNASVSLTSFTLSSTSQPICGGFTRDFTASPTVTALDLDAKTVTVSLNDRTLTSSGEPLKFTVFTLAKENLTNLSISFTYTANGTSQTRKLDLKNAAGTFHTYKPACKHRIYGISFPQLLDAEGNDGLEWKYSAAGEALTWDSGTI